MIAEGTKHRIQVGSRWLTCAVVAVLLVGCVGTPPTDANRIAGKLSVLASTSLTDVITALARSFESSHRDVDVTVNFDTGSRLIRMAEADQASRTGAGSDGVAADRGAVVLLTEGAPALPEPFLAAPATIFARNQLVVAVAPGNPKGLANLNDLARPGLRVAICAATEPCGLTSAAALRAAGVTLPAATRVSDTRAARNLVAQGRVDAALVYRTDTHRLDRTLATLEFLESASTRVDYNAASLRNASNPATAQAFINYLRAPEATALLSAAAFQSPP